jgi:hypothetical protein
MRLPAPINLTPFAHGINGVIYSATNA